MLALPLRYCLYLPAMILLLSTAADAEIYTYRDHNGHFYITDQKLTYPYRLINTQRNTQQHIKRGYNPQTYKNNVRKYLPHIQNIARSHRLDPNLIHAIIDTESSFDPQAKSKAGAIGLMQLMPKTAQQLGVNNSWNPQQNIQGGVLLMRQLLNQFHQNIRLSLAAYNAGANAVIQAGYKIPNYPETKRYVKKVMRRYHELNAAI